MHIYMQDYIGPFSLPSVTHGIYAMPYMNTSMTEFYGRIHYKMYSKIFSCDIMYA